MDKDEKKCVCGHLIRWHTIYRCNLCDDYCKFEEVKNGRKI
jgi:hypothetical protein